MQIVNKNEFSEIIACVPQIKEQRVIGTFFESLDNLITLHQRNKNKITGELYEF
jgi:type I restriction enzyme S subunit